MKTFKPIIIAVVISILLLATRMLFTMRITYLFLIWNLFLAYIPLYISTMMISNDNLKINRLVNVLLFLLWIIFLPNAPYIITDLYHLNQFIEMPNWFDLILILFFAMSGMIFWLMSVQQIHRKFLLRFKTPIQVLIICTIVVLSSIGVYLGRYLRWNTWYLFYDAPKLISELFNMLIYPAQYSDMYGMTIAFSLFLGFIYLSLSGMIIRK